MEDYLRCANKLYLFWSPNEYTQQWLYLHETFIIFLLEVQLFYRFIQGFSVGSEATVMLQWTILFYFKWKQ